MVYSRTEGEKLHCQIKGKSEDRALKKMTTKLRRIKLPVVLLILEIIFIILFALFVDYEDAANPLINSHPKSPMQESYPLFQDIHVMIFVGIAFLYTYLKRYGYSAAGYNFLLGALAIQWSVLIRAFFFGNLITEGKVKLTLKDMMLGDFNAAVVLISFGFVIGKTSPLQLVVMTIVELIFSNLNEYIGVELFQVSDIGGSMFIHVFAAYFGMALSRVIYKRGHDTSVNDDTGYKSDLFTMIGTLFLWCFWPSFNGCLAEGDAKLRAVSNTFMALTACVVVTMAISALVDNKGKFTMCHVQNSTLAGGVAIGTCANMPVKAWGAMTIGSIGGAISVLGYRYVANFLNKKLKINDPAGVNNLHGLPGILAAIAGVVMAATASEQNFGKGLYQIFPAMAPSGNGTNDHFDTNIEILDTGSDRTSSEQAGYQMAALVVTIVIAAFGGAITGFILRVPGLDSPNKDQLYDDRIFWNISEEGFPSVTKEENRFEENAKTMGLLKAKDGDTEDV